MRLRADRTLSSRSSYCPSRHPEREDLATRGGVNYLVYARQRKVILWARLVEPSIINTHPPLPSLLFDKNRIGEPVGVEYLSNESCCQEFGDLFTYGPTPLIIKAMQALLSGLQAQDEAQCVLGDVPRYARHVRWLPCEDITIGVQEVDELAFLFGRELGPDPHRLARVGGVDPHRLGFLERIEGRRGGWFVVV